MFSKDSSFEPNQPNKTAAVEGVRESVLKFLKFCSLECLLLSKPTSSLGPECGWSFSVQVGTCPRRTLSVRKTHFSEDTTLKKYVVLGASSVAQLLPFLWREDEFHGHIFPTSLRRGPKKVRWGWPRVQCRTNCPTGKGVGFNERDMFVE